MLPLMDVVTDHLESQDVRFSQIAGRDEICLAFSMSSVNVHCRFRISEDRRLIVFTCESGVRVPVERSAEMLAFAAAVNLDIAVGALQYRAEDGDLLIRTSLFAPDVELEPGLVEPLWRAAIELYNRYYPGIVDVVYRGVRADVAIAGLRDAEDAVDQGDVDAAVARLLEEFPDGGRTDVPVTEAPADAPVCEPAPEKAPPRPRSRRNRKTPAEGA